MFHKISLVLRLPLSIIESLIPKNKKIWIFGSWFGAKFADNSKYFYHFLNENSDINAIWIYKDKTLEDYFKKEKLKACYYKSFSGIFYQLLASKVFVSHSISSDLNPLFISLNTQRIQMWHGVPLKKIMYDNPAECKWWNKSRLYRLFTNNFYNYVLSPGPEFNAVFASAFGVSNKKIIDCGYPRNDVFTRTTKVMDDENRLKVIYMPTYRSNEQSKDLLFSERCKFDFLRLDSFLTANLIELTIRVHPANLPPQKLLEELKKSKSVRLSSSDDVYEEINNYDCLITDYSSILFDFAITKKPIIFSAFDLSEYLSEEREMYHVYQDISGGDEARNWDEVLQKLLELKAEPQKFIYGTVLQKISGTVVLGEKNSFSKMLYNKLCPEDKLNY
ncbi:CDP-glycerol glycerophosphotransferase family protein [Citrobacter sp. R56]|uniref:CDP-glycerol glycerophosphotransferase family protein n=1 Tax=Citrobacter sp. R56 TaxID=1573676 RepID=UPI00193B5F12|nr:CDP-glycerol glycerophosphotransferase family protein [Citrobacter sp. R56]QRG80664.1 CDP-glycerol glycerophosphotransferase family protein [Citrobacter sp. R56]